MGYSAYSYAVFGVRVPRSQIKKPVNVRSCVHDVQHGMNFCPECGKPVYTQKTQDILESMDSKNLSYFYSDYEGNGDVVIGFCVGKTDYDNNTEPVECKVPTPGMALELVEFFKEHNLPYTEKHIKMYVMTYHSY